MPITFSLLLNIASASNAHDTNVLWGFISRYVPGATVWAVAERTAPQPDKGFEVAYSVAGEARIVHARRLMSDNHYGWFERVQPGIYALSPKGVKAIGEYAAELANIAAAKSQEPNPGAIAPL